MDGIQQIKKRGEIIPTELTEINNNRSRWKLGQILVKAGKISPDQLWKALNRQEKLNMKLGNILVMMHLISPEELQQYLVEQIPFDEIDLKKVNIDFRIVEELGKDFCLKNNVIPIDEYWLGDRRTLRFALRSKSDIVNVSTILKDYILMPYIAQPEAFEQYLDQIQKHDDSVDTLFLE